MASRDRPIADARLSVRIPKALKLTLEAIAYAKCMTLSDIVTHLLETHPEVVRAVELIYTGLEGVQNTEGKPK